MFMNDYEEWRYKRVGGTEGGGKGGGGGGGGGGNAVM